MSTPRRDAAARVRARSRTRPETTSAAPLRPDTAGAGGIERVLLQAVRVGVMAVLIVPLIVTPSTYFPFVVGKAVYARTVIEITFALWVILIAYRPHHRPSRSWIVMAFGVWLAVSLAAGLAGVSPVRSVWSTYERMQGVFDLAHWFAYVLVAGSVFASPREWRVPFTFGLAVGVGVAAIGVSGLWWLDLDVVDVNGRLVSTLGNAAFLGAYAMFGSMIAVGMIVHSYASSEPATVREPAPAVAQGGASGRFANAGRPLPSFPRRRESTRARAAGELPYKARSGVEAGGDAATRRWRWPAGRPGGWLDGMALLRAFWLLATMLHLWALWLTGTRGAIVGLGAGAVVFAVAYLARGTIRAVRWAALGVLAAALAAVVLVVLAKTTPALDPVTESSPTLGRLASIGLDDHTVSARLTGARAGLRALRDRPLLGWGPENFLIAWGRYHDKASGVTERYDQAHSKVIEELTTKGALGLLAYLLIWLAMARVAWRSLRRGTGHAQVFIAVFGATAAAYFVQNLFLFDTTTTMMLFALLAAFLVSEERRLGVEDAAEGSVARPRRGAGARRRGEPCDRRAEGSAARPRQGAGETSGPVRRPGLRLVPRPVRGPAGVAVVVVVVVSALAGALPTYAFRPFIAAASVAEGVGDPAPWSPGSALRRGIHELPGLGNLPRFMLISRATRAAANLPEEELSAVARVVGAEGRSGLEAEPESWRLRMFLAQFHQVASLRNPAHVAIAREHLDEAVRLAPGTHGIVELVRNQEQLEGWAQ